MIIYSMTATFGKLSHKTLSLQPGLNVIAAPNEWGKSTWSAFILAMFYGIDTGSRRRKDTLPDKEHYAPWSGEPMSGKIDLQWNGKDITIERSCKGRVPFGEFRAYETASGISVPELNGENCGVKILGVEKSVFQRSGFLRLQDLPVTEDEALRQRLNALVTTGDESGTGENLERKLRELRNRVHHNSTGLLPQAETEQENLKGRLRSLDSLQQQLDETRRQEQQLQDFREKLENHKVQLAYQESLSYTRQAEEAERQLESARAEAERMDTVCMNLPTEQQLQEKLDGIQALREKQESLQADAGTQKTMPEYPQCSRTFLGMSPREAILRTEKETEEYRDLMAYKGRPPILLWILAAVSLAGSVGLFVIQKMVGGAVLAILGTGSLIAALVLQIRCRNARANCRAQAEILQKRYENIEPDQWVTEAKAYAEVMTAYQQELQEYENSSGDLEEKIKNLQQEVIRFTGGKTLAQTEQELRRALMQHEIHGDAIRELQRARQVAEAFTGGPAQPKMPAAPDTMTFTDTETDRKLTENQQDLQKMRERAGRIQGQMDSLGSRVEIERDLRQTDLRIEKLRRTETALMIAQKAREKAEAELQKRFSPRIAGRAQELLACLTGGRYDRVMLDDNMNLQSRAAGETVMRQSLWRSDGTVDQLYLALRIAVAEELTPEAPLILDDALVRFDDERLKAALKILKEEPKQVILFSCQQREKKILAEL